MKTVILGSVLNHAYAHESRRPEQVWLTQPVGGARVVDITWRQALDEARRMATHLRARGLQRGERVAMLAGNSAHFAIAELAIWIAGGTTVAVLPTESTEHIRRVLEDCEARALFVGKLEGWPRQRSAIPAQLPCIALPLAPRAADPANACSHDGWLDWDDIVARTPPLEGRPGRCTDEVAMRHYTPAAAGRPQCVMQTFGSITRAVQALLDEQLACDGGQRLPGRMLSHLPLAQGFERTRLLWFSLVSGRTQVFFVERSATFIEDMKRARPTLLLAAPSQWIEWQQAVLAQWAPAALDALLADPATAPAARAQVLGSLGLDAVQRAWVGAASQPKGLAWWRRLGLNPIADHARTEDFDYPRHVLREDAADLVDAGPSGSYWAAPPRQPTPEQPTESKPAMPPSTARMDVAAYA
jgi:long-chain acyl-CoA synthetase